MSLVGYIAVVVQAAICVGIFSAVDLVWSNKAAVCCGMQREMRCVKDG